MGMAVDEIYEACRIDKWLSNGWRKSSRWTAIIADGLPQDADTSAHAEGGGISTSASPPLTKQDEEDVPPIGISSACGRVQALDSCAAEFASPTAYMYRPTRRRLQPACVRSSRSTGEDRHSRWRPEPHRPGHRGSIIAVCMLFRAVGGGYETS